VGHLNSSTVEQPKLCGIICFWSFLSFAEHNGSRFSWHCCRDMDIPYAGP
jgi:hypothetical protein